MAEVLHTYESRVDDEGVRFTVRACGRREPDAETWEGWLEFLPDDGSPPLRSERETTQPNRTDLVYWATGVTAVYLEGALERARRASSPKPEREVVVERPYFDGPAGAKIGG